jgi:hypothetical protein
MPSIISPWASATISNDRLRLRRRAAAQRNSFHHWYEDGRLNQSCGASDETRQDVSLDQLKKRARLKSASSILCRPLTICSLMTDAPTICHRQNTIG